MKTSIERAKADLDTALRVNESTPTSLIRGLAVAYLAEVEPDTESTVRTRIVSSRGPLLQRESKLRAIAKQQGQLETPEGLVRLDLVDESVRHGRPFRPAWKVLGGIAFGDPEQSSSVLRLYVPGNPMPTSLHLLSERHLVTDDVQLMTHRLLELPDEPFQPLEG
jgi:hypothetical protein